MICDYCKHRPCEQEISSVIHTGFRGFVLDFDNTLPLIRQHDVVVQSFKKTKSWNVEVDFSNLDSRTRWLDFVGQRSRLIFTYTSNEVMTVLKQRHHNVLQNFIHDQILTFILTRLTTSSLVWHQVIGVAPCNRALILSYESEQIWTKTATWLVHTPSRQWV